MKVSTLFRTVRHLRPGQIIARVSFQFRRVRVGVITSPTIVERSGPWVRPAPRRGKLLGWRHFQILGQEIDLSRDRNWDRPGHDKLLLYHLHYMDVLNAQNGTLETWQGEDLLERWVLDNPAPAGNGWEPYPLSLRMVNWIKWHLKGNHLNKLATESLFLQSRALSQQIEYHLLANHLLANAKALFFAGLFFDGAEADAWKALGARILKRELQEQILSDGGHFELSPMYHAIITEDLLDIVNISRAFGDRTLQGIDALVGKMLDWLVVMTHPDGQLPYFNDATQAVAAPLSELVAYGKRLGIESNTLISEGVNALPASGYVRYQHGRAAIFIDIGKIGPDYQPGHAHCDLLSFEFSLGPRRFLVNRGISTYKVDNLRQVERATASHNTVSIASAEQSEIWSAFRVGRRARPIDVDIGPQYVQAAHDGYRHCGIIHRRRFEFRGSRFEIKDKLESSTPQIGVAHFHFHPDVEPLLTDNLIEVDGVEISFQNATNVELIDYDYCVGFNARLPSKKVAVTFEQTLLTSIVYEDSIHNR